MAIKNHLIGPEALAKCRLYTGQNNVMDVFSLLIDIAIGGRETKGSTLIATWLIDGDRRNTSRRAKAEWGARLVCVEIARGVGATADSNNESVIDWSL